jgi:hypothetical protein
LIFATETIFEHFQAPGKVLDVMECFYGIFGHLFELLKFCFLFKIFWIFELCPKNFGSDNQFPHFVWWEEFFLLENFILAQAFITGLSFLGFRKLGLYLSSFNNQVMRKPSQKI